MALFFDAEWFDARLAARSVSRSDIARALGIDDVDVALIWKDQRELSARDVGVIAAFLGATTHEVAARAGISTPIPRPAPIDAAAFAQTLADIHDRMARLERTLGEMKSLLLELRNRP